MDRTWITSARRFSAAYVEGVENFMNFIRAEYGGPKSDVLCPCSSCMNSVTRPQSTVQNHLHFNEVAQQDDAYTAPDVQDNTDVPNIFQNHHVNDADEKIACCAVDIQELIKKKPTFEDVEDEEEDDTVGNYDSD